jgi:hypothetical protein
MISARLKAHGVVQDIAKTGHHVPGRQTTPSLERHDFSALEQISLRGGIKVAPEGDRRLFFQQSATTWATMKVAHPLEVGEEER